MSAPCPLCSMVGCSFACMKRQRDNALATIADLTSERQTYPRGQLTPDDQGELTLAVSVRDGTIVIDFMKPVSWMGLGYNEARSFAAMLITKSEEIKQ